MPARVLLPTLVAVLTTALLLAPPAESTASASAAPDSPALTPPLDWNSWNTFGCDINETLIRQAADAMASSGMRAAGYRHVVVDDCWQDPQRDSQGNLRGHPTRFPSGMKALGDDGQTEVFAKPLNDGSVAVGLFNRGGSSATVSTTAAQIGLGGNGQPNQRWSQT